MLVPAMLIALTAGLSAQTVVFDSISNPVPPNVPSQGFQCCATSEFGDQIQLAGAPRVGGYVTVLMSDWAKHSDYPAMNSGGFIHPITLNVYADVLSARNHVPMLSVTQSFLIPWRPPTDTTCNDDAWRSPIDHNCYHGFAFTITFDLRSAGPGGTTVQLPDTLIYGVAYNTNSWGYHPLFAAGPYESLNVGLNAVSGPTVGTDVNPDGVFWNTAYGPFYADGGAAGINVFRQDTNWTGYVPAVRFQTYAFATTAEACKNGGWQQLVRRDFTPFKNQGDCVSYTNNGK